MEKSINKNTIERFDKLARDDQKTRSSRNASFRNDLQEISMDWDHFRKIDHSFSHIVKEKCQLLIKNRVVAVGVLQG